MGYVVPAYRSPVPNRPIFEQPRGTPFMVWEASVIELMTECPPPVGLWDDPEPVILRPDPRDPTP